MTRTAWAAGIGLALVWSAQAAAQQNPTSSISGTGTAVIEKQPQILRLYLDITAQSKSLKDALARLKERREKALERFAEWGAEKESIVVGAPRTLADPRDQQQRMAMMVQARLQSKSAPAKVDPIVKVACNLKAEWKLEGLDADAILLRSHELREQIESADLAGVKADQAASPEEQEEMEEMEGMQYFGGEEQPPGEPAILYVSHISGEEFSAALEKAYSDARRDAEQLAAAAKVTLGKLINLSQHSAPDYSQTHFYGNSRQAMLYQYMQQAQMNEGSASREAIGADPGKIAHRVNVSAVFAMR